jgi:hypothetical protein
VLFRSQNGAGDAHNLIHGIFLSGCAGEPPGAGLADGLASTHGFS